MDTLSRSPRKVTSSAAARRGRRPSRTFRPSLGVERFEERTLLSLALVSANAAGTASGNSDSTFPSGPFGYPGSLRAAGAALSADGKFLVFQGDATDLVAGLYDTNKATDVFVRNLQTGQTTLVSATPGGKVGNGMSFDPVISPDGRYVAFLSTATNLTGTAANPPSPGMGGTVGLLYVRDLQSGTTTLLDVTPDGKPANGFATGTLAFSPDSKSLAFTDSSTNLTSTPPSNAPPAQNSYGYGYGSPPSQDNVYLRDLAAGTTTAVSVTPGGTLSQGNAMYSGPSSLVFSPDGTKLAFTSTAADMADALQDNTPASSGLSIGSASNIFVSNLATHATTLVSITPDGHVGNGSSYLPVFSPDGHRLAFLSSATNLTPDATGGSQGNQNLFVRDLAARSTTLVSVTPSNSPSSGNVSEAVFSPDGQSLAFISSGTDLTNNAVDPPPPTPAPTSPSDPIPSPMYTSNVFVRNLSSGTTTAVSVTPDGKLSDGSASNLGYGPGGQTLAYLSNATDLTANPSPTPPATAPTAVDPTTSPVVTNMTPVSGAPMTSTMPPPAPATNLFLSNLATRATALVSVTPTGTLSSGNVLSYAFSPDGTKLAFDAMATDLTNNPPGPSSPAPTGMGLPPSSSNVFVRDLTAQATTLVSASPDGTLAPDPSFSGPSPLVFSPDGQTLYFSTGGALVASDTNHTTDIYAATAPFAAPGQIHFASWQYRANEPDGQAVITVVRSAPLDAASVAYAVQDGTARAGNDYQASAGTLSFAPGQASASFTIPLNAAAAFADTRTATITLSNPSGASLGLSTATLNLSGNMQTPPTSITTAVSSTSTTPQTTASQTPTTPTGTPTITTPNPTSTTTTTAATTPTSATPTPTPTSTSTATMTPTPTTTPTPTPTPTTTPTPTPTASTTPTPTPTASTASTTPTPTPTASTTSTTPTTASTNPTTPTTTSTTPTTSTPTPAPTTTSTTPTASTPTPTATSTNGANEGTASAIKVQSASSPTNAQAVNANTPGPVVSSLSLQTVRRKVAGLVITFNGPLAGSSASNLANYSVHLLTPGHRRKHSLHSMNIGRNVAIAAVQYDANAHTVTLTFSSRLSAKQWFQLSINGGQGGITDPSGNPLNSPSQGAPGSDSTLAVNPRVI